MTTQDKIEVSTYSHVHGEENRQSSTRQIIQIASSSRAAGQVTALCDDGTLWSTDDLQTWRLIPSVPQNEVDGAKAVRRLPEQLLERALFALVRR